MIFQGVNQLGGYYSGGFYPGYDDEKTTPQRYQEMFESLVAQSLGLTQSSDFDTLRLPDDRVRLFVYAPMPENHFIQSDFIGKQAGYVLYCLDVFKPENP